MSAPAVTLTVHPRIHLTLIDLGDATFRVNGGVGFAVDAFPTKITAMSAERDRLILPTHFDAQGRRDLEDALLRLREHGVYPPTELTVLSPLPQHVGFGTKTSTVLGVLRAVSLLYGTPVADAELVHLSRRGGTSGIGIATFFRGGFIADAGRKRAGCAEYKPSGSAQPGPPSITMMRLPMPAQWRCHLILAPGIRRSRGEESTFFRLHTPVDEHEVLKVLAAVYHGICPAVVEADFRLFREALHEVHHYGFKRREVCGQPALIAELLSAINGNARLAAGMSSMGPLLHVMEEGESASGEYLSGICADVGARYLGTFPLRNAGFEVG